MCNSHPGCECKKGFTGPHCELAEAANVNTPSDFQPATPPVAAPVAPPVAAPTATEQLGSSTGSSSSGGDSSKTGFEVFVLVVGLLAITVVVLFSVQSLLRNRQRKKNMVLEESLRWSAATSGYRDQPDANLAPRRSFADVKAHASSTDPFATHLAQKAPAPLEVEKTKEPEVYIGPPRDEDGHELHNVNII